MNFEDQIKTWMDYSGRAILKPTLIFPPVYEISYGCSDMNDMENDNMNCDKCNDKCENNNGKSVERLIRKLNKNHMDSVELTESIRQKIKEKEIILGIPITLIDVDYDEIKECVFCSDGV